MLSDETFALLALLHVLTSNSVADSTPDAMVTLILALKSVPHISSVTFIGNFLMFTIVL